MKIEVSYHRQAYFNSSPQAAPEEVALPTNKDISFGYNHVVDQTIVRVTESGVLAEQYPVQQRIPFVSEFFSFVQGMLRRDPLWSLL
jgi:hypothetical protein